MGGVRYAQDHNGWRRRRCTLVCPGPVPLGWRTVRISSDSIETKVEELPDLESDIPFEALEFKDISDCERSSGKGT